MNWYQNFFFGCSNWDFSMDKFVKQMKINFSFFRANSLFCLNGRKFSYLVTLRENLNDKVLLKHTEENKNCFLFSFILFYSLFDGSFVSFLMYIVLVQYFCFFFSNVWMLQTVNICEFHEESYDKILSTQKKRKKKN